MSESMALAIRSAQDLAQIGKMFETSGMFGCSQEGQGVFLALTCVMTGKSPLEINQTYHIIDGKLSMRADAMLARFVERGGRFKIVERSKDRAAAVFSKDENTLEAEYRMADAQEAGICFQKDGKTLKSNWRQHPKQMLWARLISDSVRAVDPGVNMGVYTPEEVQDFDDRPTPPMSYPAPKAESAPTPVSAPKAEATVAEVMEVDPTRMPAGKLKGKLWNEISTKYLQLIVDSDHASLTDAHKAAARDELARRGA